MLAAGHLLGNRYRLDERIATGGMGDVWKGTDVVLGRVIAVKVLRAAMLTDSEFAARFYGEARMMAAFRHPGVVEVYDYAGADEGDHEQVAYLVMAYVDGEPLSARVKQGPMDVTETMSIVAQAADALHAAHEAGTVHRDVKPGNLIVKPTGAVVLVDFGVARSAQVTSVTAANAIVGTALYMAPEQVAKGNVSPATDIYALGAVAYHCIAGEPPFDGDNALQVALRHLEDEPEPLPDHVPLEVRALIARAMAKQPADRFATAAEFAEAAFAAAGPMDWKRLTGTSMIAPQSPTGMGATAAGATMGAAGMGAAGMGAAGLGATGLGATRMNTGRMGTGLNPPTRGVPAPRPMPFVPAPDDTASRRPPRSQTALLVAVIALLVLAGGLAVAVALSSGDKTPTADTTPTPATSASAVESPEETDSPEPTEETTQPRERPNGTGQRPSNRPTKSASPSSEPPSTAPTSAPPTSKAPPTSATPTRTTPTDGPTDPTEPTDPPTTIPPIGGDNNAADND